MPLYDFRCNTCGLIFESFAAIDSRNSLKCKRCGAACTCLMSPVYCRRNDAGWVRDLNGIVNDHEMAMTGQMRKVETRDDYVDYVNHLYSDPHPRVQKLREEYLDRAGVKACPVQTQEKREATTSVDA